MRSLIFLLFLALPFPALLALAGGDEEGGWISGGGDPLRIHFEEGRLYAKGLVSAVSLDSSRIASPEVTAWFERNREALAADLGASEHAWHENEQTTCAFTEYRSAAPVRLSFDSCRSVSSKEEASKVLIHESVHHLGEADHSFADKVAVQLVASWEKSKLHRVNACPEETPPLVRQMLGRWRMDPELARLLAGEGERPLLSEIELQEDRQVLRRFDEFRSFHGGCALSAGLLRFRRPGAPREREVPFFIRRQGLNLFLVTFRSEADFEQRALSARLIQLVRSQPRGRDRLLLTTRPKLGENSLHPPAQPGRPRPGPPRPHAFDIESFQRL